MARVTTTREIRMASSWSGRLVQRAFANRRRFATGAAAVLALGVGYHVVFGQNGLTVYQRKRLDAQVLERQVNELASENEALQGHVERLQTDPSAIEHQAREELHYTRPGEVIYTLPPEPAQPLDTKR